MLFVLRRNSIGADLYVICPSTLIFRYYYSIEELGGREGGGGGGRTKPGPKPGKKPSAARFAHPLRGAEVLVAVRGPSPGEGEGKKPAVKEKKCEVNREKRAVKQKKCVVKPRKTCSEQKSV